MRKTESLGHFEKAVLTAVMSLRGSDAYGFQIYEKVESQTVQKYESAVDWPSSVIRYKSLVLTGVGRSCESDDNSTGRLLGMAASERAGPHPNTG